MKTVIYIDDDFEARETYLEPLQKLFGNDFDLIAIEPEFEIEDMMKSLQQYNDVVAFILDEKMNQLGKAKYLGRNLAEQLRVINSKIPIYIFTAYNDEFDSLYGPADVEYIIAKECLSDREKRNSLSAKIRRHQDIFSDIKTQRAQRLDELLLKSMTEELDEQEAEEFRMLNYLRTKSVNLQEAEFVEELSEKIKENDSKISHIEKLFKEL
ncbi:TPA: hypothetical protein ACIAIH_000169 [Enterobacter bugandensis]|uniref:hypothetical protein n=1 Tax=Enterobacter sp. BNK-13 TaxID=3376150 RepID=UPI00378652B0